VLKIRLRTRSAAESEAVLVSVSSVVNFSGMATVTNSVLVRRHEIVEIKTRANTNDRK
jgi:hypothetical protein